MMVTKAVLSVAAIVALAQPAAAHWRHHHQHYVSGRPSAWCGFYLRHQVGADPGPSYNLARNWVHWGRGGAPGVGAVVVWSHHVGKIVGRAADGGWIINSGNDGHAVRTRERSIAGAIAVRWPGFNFGG